MKKSFFRKLINKVRIIRRLQSKCDKQSMQIRRLTYQNDLLKKNLLFCEVCGSTWYADGFTAGCPTCKLRLQNEKTIA